MPPDRPQKTLADYLVIGVSPALIMLMVGSLVFFLIEVFYRGEMQAGIRWVMFWFVIAVVLVGRIGIEQGTTHASLYGLALAAATWLYLVRTHPAYLLGVVLLALVWWSANRLTWDCTLVDDDQDASGHGLLSLAWKKETIAEPATQETSVGGAQRSPRTPSRSRGRKRGRQAHAPGLWVVYFSLAALPLFGVGQVLLPSEETAVRRLGFAFLFSYLVAALGLLLTTSFLGLRRYLRQRSLTMPPVIAFGWIQSGAGVAVVVLAVALLVPRPGADYTWKTLAYQIDHQLQRASEYAVRMNPPSDGEGREGNLAQGERRRNAGGQSSGAVEPGQQSPGEDQRQATPDGQSERPQRGPSPQSLTPAEGLYLLLKLLLLLVAALVVAWWLFRRRHVILQIIHSVWQALTRFFSDLLGLGSGREPERPAKPPGKSAPTLHPFAAYRNPFVSGRDRVWPPEQLIAYSFEAVQAWAKEQGFEIRPDRTPREYCLDLSERFPEIAGGLEAVAFLYVHAAYGRALPVDPDWEPVRQVWRRLCETTAVPA